MILIVSNLCIYDYYRMVYFYIIGREKITDIRNIRLVTHHIYHFIDSILNIESRRVTKLFHYNVLYL